jgi:hypothetical protein
VLLRPNGAGILRERAPRIEREARHNAQKRQRGARTPACRVHTRVNACSAKTNGTAPFFQGSSGQVRQ